jgi:hypothetical protein
MAEWKVRTHWRAQAGGRRKRPEAEHPLQLFTQLRAGGVGEGNHRDPLGLDARWQSMNTTRSTRVVDLPEPAPAKMRVSGWRQRIIAHCSSDGGLSTRR